MTDTAAPVDPAAVLFELLMTPEGKADPYPRYATLHEVAPVVSGPLGHVFSRFDDCQAILRDPRLGKDRASFRQRFDLSDEQLARFPAFDDDGGRGPSMLFLNPPDHTRLRGLVSKAFTPRTVEKLRPHVARLTDELLDAFPSDGTEVDVMSALAFPLPNTVIGELLGVPVDDRARFQDLVRASTKTLELSVSLDDLAAANDAFLVMQDYFAGLIAERRRRPEDDLLSALIAARDEGDALSEQEIISTVILLFAAGFETTTNLIGNGLLALLDHPDQLDRLRHDPSLIRSGVEELLRFDSPVQVDGRAVLEDAEVAGVELPAGAMVVTLLGGANHDPTHFTDPGRLDVGRAEGPPMSFASGIHYCLGAALARLEGQVVIERLLERFPSIERTGADLRWRPSLTLRGLEALPVTVLAS